MSTRNQPEKIQTRLVHALKKKHWLNIRLTIILLWLSAHSLEYKYKYYFVFQLILLQKYMLYLAFFRVHMLAMTWYMNPNKADWLSNIIFLAIFIWKLEKKLWKAQKCWIHKKRAGDILQSISITWPDFIRKKAFDMYKMIGMKDVTVY